MDFNYLERLLSVLKLETKMRFTNKAYLVSSLAQPVVWLIGWGLGAQSNFTIPGLSYLAFFMPGVLAQNGQNGFYSGMFISEMRHIHYTMFWEKMLSSIPRYQLFFIDFIDSCIGMTLKSIGVVIIAFFLGVQFSLWNLLLAFGCMLLVCALNFSFGVIMGCKIDKDAIRQLVNGILLLPVTLCSGMYFPLQNLPSWFEFIVRMNPMTYCVDLVRGAAIGVNYISPETDLIVVVGLIIVLGTIALKEYSNVKVNYEYY